MPEIAPQAAPPQLIITQAGYDALINAKKDGVSGVTITQIGLTAKAFVPTDDLTELPNELKRLDTIAGGATGRRTMHVQIRDESADTYNLYGFGLYLDNGVLLAVYGQATPLMAKSGRAVALIAMDVAFDNIDAALIQFGDTNFQVPGATTVTPGVIRIATTAECRAGTVTDAAVTPSGLAATLAAKRFYPGQIIVTAAKKAPPGTMICDGRYLSVAEFPDLYAAIGTDYGSNGAGTFRIPRVIEGAPSLETTLIDKVGLTTSGENLAHTHVATTAASGAHTHGVTTGAAGVHAHAASASAVGDHTHATWTDEQGWHGHTGATTGAGDHGHVLQENVVVDLGGAQGNIVYSGGGTSRLWSGGGSRSPTHNAGNHAHSLSIDGNGAHGHNISMNGAGNHGHTISVGDNGSHTHPITENAASAHDHAVTVESQGGARNLPAGMYRLTCIAY